MCAPEAQALAARALERALAESPEGWDAFVGDLVPADGDFRAHVAATGARTLRRESSPVLAITGRSWDELLAGWSSNLRGQVRRRERKLAREHELRFHLADAATLDRDLDTLMRLHELRWGAESSAFGGPRDAFHRDFARCALDRGLLRLWITEVDGEPAAAWLGFRFGVIDWSYHSGSDPHWVEHSLRFVMVDHSIRTAVEDGMRSYRFLRGG